MAVVLLWYLKIHINCKVRLQRNARCKQLKFLSLFGVCLMQFSECIHIREGVHELLQVIRSEADLVIQHVVMCWPCCPLPMQSQERPQLNQMKNKHTFHNDYSVKIDKHNTTKTIKCMSTCRESTHNPDGVSTHVEIIAPVVADSLVHNSACTQTQTLN